VLLTRLTPHPQQARPVLTVLADVFLPLYFISVGMRIDAGTLLQPASWWFALVLIVLALLSKLVCAFGITARERLGGVDRVPEPEVGVGIGAAVLGGHDDRLGELAPELAPLGVDERFLAGDVRPVGMSCHGTVPATTSRHDQRGFDFFSWAECVRPGVLLAPADFAAGVLPPFAGLCGAAGLRGAAGAGFLTGEGGFAASTGFFAAGFGASRLAGAATGFPPTGPDSAGGSSRGLIVIALPACGLTTKGLGPGLPPATAVPSAARFGPAPGGGNGVLPAGRAAA
jgi:hypothetical protein